MVKARLPPGDLLTYAYSLALAESKAKKDAHRTSILMMNPISEDEKPTNASATASGDGNLDESRKAAALHHLLAIVDENKIIIDDHLRRVIAGEGEKYTSSDAAESIRRSSTANDISSSVRRRPSTGKGSLFNRSRRQLGSMLRKSSSRSDSGDTKESGDTDSSISSAPPLQR